MWSDINSNIRSPLVVLVLNTQRVNEILGSIFFQKTMQRIQISWCIFVVKRPLATSRIYNKNNVNEQIVKKRVSSLESLIVVFSSRTVRYIIFLFEVFQHPRYIIVRFIFVNVYCFYFHNSKWKLISELNRPIEVSTVRLYLTLKGICRSLINSKNLISAVKFFRIPKRY